MSLSPCSCSAHTAAHTHAPCSPQAEALARALPREFVPAELMAQEALGVAVQEAALAAGAGAAAGGPLDSLEAVCLQDELQLFRWAWAGTEHLGCCCCVACEALQLP